MCASGGVGIILHAPLLLSQWKTHQGVRTSRPRWTAEKYMEEINMSASERLPASCASAPGERRYIALSHDHVGCVVVYSRYGDGPVVVAQVVPDGTTVSVSPPAGGRWRYAGAMIPERDDVVWPYSGCGKEKFRTPLNEEPILDNCFSSFEVYADDGWDNLLDDTPYFIVRSHLDRLIDGGIPITILSADQTVSRAGQIVDSWAVELVNRALGMLDIKYTPLPFNLRRYITCKDFKKLAFDLYEAISGKEVLEASCTVKPFFEEESDCWQTGTSRTNKLLTRGQAAAILARAYVERLKETIPGENAAAFMAEKGIVGGLDGGRFDPKDNVRCEEALIMALRMFETLK